MIFKCRFCVKNLQNANFYAILCIANNQRGIVMESSFGAFLRQNRQNKQLTQKDLASLLFVSESAVSKWEKGISHPDITLLPKLSEILGVSEHELITASVDHQAREEKSQARKWRALSFSWSLFFYIAYAVALIPCFICNLAIDKTLSWFWIVVASLLLAFSFTNLPRLIKRNKLLFLPLLEFVSLCILLGVCAVYTRGNWFFIATLSTLLGLLIIFLPIYIAKYKVFAKVKKYNDFVTVAVAFILLNILLIVINDYTLSNGYGEKWWYVRIALPIVLVAYLVLNLLLSVRFLKINKCLKTSVILGFIALWYMVPPCIKVANVNLQQEIDQANIFKADFSAWQVNGALENNIHLIIFLSLLGVALVFLAFGLLLRSKKRKNG